VIVNTNVLFGRGELKGIEMGEREVGIRFFFCMNILFLVQENRKNWWITPKKKIYINPQPLRKGIVIVGEK